MLRRTSVLFLHQNISCLTRTFKHLQLVGLFSCHNSPFFSISFISFLFPPIFHRPNQIISIKEGDSVPLQKERVVSTLPGEPACLHSAVSMPAQRCSPHPQAPCCIPPFSAGRHPHIPTSPEHFLPRFTLPITSISAPHCHWQALPSTAWSRDLLLPGPDQAWSLGLAHSIPTGPCPASQQLWQGPLPVVGNEARHLFQRRNKVLLAAGPPVAAGSVSLLCGGRWWSCRRPASTTGPPRPQPHMPRSAAVTTCHTRSHFSSTANVGEANAPKGKLCFSALVATRPEAPEVQEVGDSDSLPGEALVSWLPQPHGFLHR